MSDKKAFRRKYSSVDLQQIVTHLDEYERPLNSQGGKSGALLGFVHLAAVATTRNGELYLLETGVSQNDDINYKNGLYREGECRIARITRKDIQDWRLVRSVQRVNPGVTLEDLFDACGTDYGELTNNCWNSTQRMRVCANDAEDGLSWQGKAAIGAAGVGLALGAIGVLAAVLSGDKEKQAQKN